MTPWQFRQCVARAAVVLGWIAAFTCSPGLSWAQAPKTHPPAADTDAAGGMSADSPDHDVLLALQQMHLTVCAPKVQQAMNFIFDGQPARFVAQPLGPDSDRWPTVFVIESADPAGGHTRLSTLTVSPGCAGMYEQVIYWTQPCASIKTSVFAKFNGEHVLMRDVKVSDDGPALQVYLSPAGSGCVSVKKELFR